MALAFLQETKGVAKDVLALGKKHSVVRPFHDPAQGLLDRMSNHGVADCTIPSMWFGLVQSA
jgi:hypothetical protein